MLGNDSIKAWPNGCAKPNTCERHGMCMYGCHQHVNRDITDEIAAAIAALDDKKKNTEIKHAQSSQKQCEDQILEYIGKYFQGNQGIVRSTLSDVAHLCDAMVFDIKRDHTVRGKLTKEGKVRVDAVNQIASVVWELRDKIKVGEPS